MAAMWMSSVTLLVLFSKSQGLQKVEDHGRPCTYFGNMFSLF